MIRNKSLSVMFLSLCFSHSLFPAETRILESGIRFPDGTTQTTAATSGGSTAFPVPAYDSGWRNLEDGKTAATLTHDIGGNVENYVVDLSRQTFRPEAGPWYRTSFGTAGMLRYSSGVNLLQGLYWKDLTSTEITVSYENVDVHNNRYRIRIWKY